MVMPENLGDSAAQWIKDNLPSAVTDDSRLTYKAFSILTLPHAAGEYPEIHSPYHIQSLGEHIMSYVSELQQANISDEIIRKIISQAFEYPGVTDTIPSEVQEFLSKQPNLP